jgi:DNA-binding response OmpR family regulator
MSEILFLSSDPVLQQKNMQVMQQSGLEAVGQSSCLDGLVQLDKNRFQVVVIDDELDDATGYEACLKVRQQTSVFIVLLGVVAESEAWSRVEELGFDLYLRKPVSPRELLARIKSLLRRPAGEVEAAMSREQGKGQAVGTVQAAIPRPGSPRVENPIAEVSRPQSGPGTQVNPVAAELRSASLPQSQQRAAGSSEYFEQMEQQPASQTPVSQKLEAPDAPSPVSPPVERSELREKQIPVGAMDKGQTAAGRNIVQPVAPLKREAAPIVVPPLQRELAGVVNSAHSQPRVSQPAVNPVNVQGVAGEENDGSAMLSDPRVIKLVDALVSGTLPDITPVIDFSYKKGFAYPSVSSMVDANETDTINILETLAENGILIKEPFEKFYIDPDGLFQLVPTERCPRCDSANVIKGQLVEHFSCGFVGLDRDFKQDSRYVCPKCRKDMRLIGTDYRNVGIHYRCQDCNEVFTTPVIKWRNMKTRKVWNPEELHEVETFSYQFSPDKKGWLEFQMKPKNQLVEFLRSQDYQVHELAQLTGRSGAVHTVDVLAIRDDIITKIYMGIGILVAATGETEVGLESLFRFDTRAYDIGINYKVVIAIPKLGQEAINFAGRQMIRAYEAKTLAAVVSDLTQLDRSRVGMPGKAELVDSKPHAPEDSAGTKVVRFLRKRGYEVYEQALILGKSGVEHVFDIFARKDDRLVIPTIAIGIANGAAGQPVGLDELSKFDAAAFDSGIRNKVFFGLPTVSDQARQFAVQQKIDIFEQQDLGRLT